jgi:hypothetical protein
VQRHLWEPFIFSLPDTKKSLDDVLLCVQLEHLPQRSVNVELICRKIHTLDEPLFYKPRNNFSRSLGSGRAKKSVGFLDGV